MEHANEHRQLKAELAKCRAFLCDVKSLSVQLQVEESGPLSKQLGALKAALEKFTFQKKKAPRGQTIKIPNMEQMTQKLLEAKSKLPQAPRTATSRQGTSNGLMVNRKSLDRAKAEAGIVAAATTPVPASNLLGATDKSGASKRTIDGGRGRNSSTMQNSVVRQFMQKKNFSSHHNDTAEIELDGSTISQNEEASMLRRLPVSGRDTFEGPATSTIGQSAISGTSTRQIEQESSVGAF
jgi:hypothetical protein